MGAGGLMPVTVNWATNPSNMIVHMLKGAPDILIPAAAFWVLTGPDQGSGLSFITSSVITEENLFLL